MKQESWCLPVTLVNAKTGSIAEITYPCSNAEMIEALARCKIPYGSGAYYHKVEEDHMDGRRKDVLTKALAGTIGSKAAPPTMRELNFLAAQIQCMPERKRDVLRKNISQLPASSMADILLVVQDYSQMSVDDNVQELSVRAALWDENNSYFQVAIRSPQTEEAEIIDCPIDHSALAAIQNKLSIRNIDACIEQVDGVISCGSEISFADINRLASALKENHVGQQLGKLFWNWKTAQMLKPQLRWQAGWMNMNSARTRICRTCLDGTFRTRISSTTMKKWMPPRNLELQIRTMEL